MKDAPAFRARSRAHGLLRSAAGPPSKALAKPYQVHRVPVSAWLKPWEQDGAPRLSEKPRSGRPSILRPAERDSALPYLTEEPHARKRVRKRFADKTNQRLSLSALKRLAKKARLRWQGVRKSRKSLRAPDAFAKANRELEGLQHHEDPGQLALYYFDESGLALDPTMPYAGPAPQSVIELPARPAGRINVLGFMHRQNDVPPFLVEGAVPTGGVRACCDAFWHPLTKQTGGGRDNASIHTRAALADRRPYGPKTGLIIKSLPPYSPALPLSDLLGRRITYPWLPCSAYEGLNALREALETILRHVGSEYQITFA